MTRKLASSRTVRWIGGLSILFTVATAALVLRGDEDDDINPIGILWRRGREKTKQDEKDKPQQPGGPPSDVPKAPPAQYTQQQAKAQPVSESADPLMKYVDEALRLNQRRLLVAESPNGKPNSPWQIMHGILALRHNLELRTPNGTVNAVAWVSRDPVFRGDHWFEATRFGGRAHPFSVPYHFEGHVNQFLALLTMCNLPLDHKIGVAGGKYVTMADMVKHAQLMVNSNEEISWTLWFLTHYLEPDAEWTNFNGERWGMEKLVSIQTQQNVVTAPCGGTHGLFALAYARNSYLQKHGKVKGTWLAADHKIQQYIREANEGMNADGSFSSAFFREAKQHTDDPTDRLKTSGHMLEWLMMAVPQQQLREQWVRYGVYRVAQDLIAYSNQEIDPGPLYHSLHAITLYRERAMPKQIKPQDPKPMDSQLAKDPKTQPAPQATPPKPTPAPPLPGVDPKSVTTAPKNPVSPRPIESPPKTAMNDTDKDTSTSPSTAPKTVPTPPPATSPVKEEPKVAEGAPRPIRPVPEATPVPMPIANSPPKAAPAPEKGDAPLVLPTLPSNNVADKRPPSVLPLDKPVGTVATPPHPTPVEPPTVAEAPVGNLPVPPTFDLPKRATVRDTKPEGTTADAPKPSRSNSPKPIVLPPLPLDPVDQPTVGGK